MSKELLDHIEELDHALQSDGENGVKWLNEMAAERWARTNRELIKWIKKLKELTDQESTPSQSSGIEAAAKEVFDCAQDNAFEESRGVEFEHGTEGKIVAIIAKHCFSKDVVADIHRQHLREKDVLQQTIKRQQQELNAFSKAAAPLVAYYEPEVRSWKYCLGLAMKELKPIVEAVNNRRIG